MRAASRSSDSTTQDGKSTLMRFCSWLARRAVDKSRSSMMSFSPSSNFLSKSLAFIHLYLSFSRTPYRNEPNCSVSVSDDRRTRSGSAYVALHRRPRIITAKVPQIPLLVAAGIQAAAVVLIFRRCDNHRATRDRLPMMGIDISHDDINALRNRRVPGAQRLLQLAISVIPCRPEHDHAIAQCQLGMGNATVLAR